MATTIDVMLLGSLSASLASACGEVQAMTSQPTLNLADVKSLGERLKIAANGLRDLFGTLESGNKPVKDYFDKIGKESEDHLWHAHDLNEARASMQKILAMVALSPTSAEKPNDLQSLFRNISTSLIEAQKELNRSSLEYASSLDPRIPQTYYGIPTVKAEMRVGFNKIEGKGVNLFFFTSTKQKQEYAESLVSFEVVGSPPPPGPVTFGDYIVPVPRLLVIDETREALLNEILEQKLVSGTTYTNTRDQAVVLRYERDKDETLNRYLVIWYGQKTNQTGPNWNGISMIYAIGRVTSGGEKELFEFPNGNKENTIFEFPPPRRVLTIPPATPPNLAAAVEPFAAGDTPEIKLAKLSIDLGDVIMNVNEIVNGWLTSMRYKTPE